MKQGYNQSHMSNEAVIDLTILSPQLGRSRSPLKPGKIESIIIVEEHDPDVTFVPPEQHSPAKKQCKINEAIQESLSKTENGNSTEGDELKMTFFQPGLKFPHSWEHCTEKKFMKGFVDNSAHAVSINKQTCEQCYCFVCEVVASQVVCFLKHSVNS